MIFDGNLIRRFLRSRFWHVSLGAVGVELLVNFLAPQNFRASFVTPPIQLMFSRGVRQTHNLKVSGSNPAPATNTIENTHTAIRSDGGFFLFFGWRRGDGPT